jgi:antirestriction protein ArdC
MTTNTQTRSSGQPTKAHRDFRQEVTDTIVSLLEQGVAPWQKPWEPGTNPLGMPMNPTTGKAYRGGNALHLMAINLQRGYEDPRWMTYKQASEQGWQVRKGEKGTHIEFWDVQPAADNPRDDASPENGSTDKPRLIHRVYTVFNVKQIAGIPPYTPNRPTAFEAVHAGEQILANSGAKISHDQADRAFYDRVQDDIHLPPQHAFKDPAGYYGTALHELAHWTGHPWRLNRPTLNEPYRFGDKNYAKEELRAELASVFLAAQRGIPHNPDRHAAYVGSWIQALQDDKNEIFRAAHDASAATEFLLALERAKSIGKEESATGPIPSSAVDSNPSAVLKDDIGEIPNDGQPLKPTESNAELSIGGQAISHAEASSAEKTASGPFEGVPSDAEKTARPSVDYVYRYAVVAGEDRWKWQRQGTLVWTTAKIEREAIEQINVEASKAGVAARIRDTSVYRPGEPPPSQPPSKHPAPAPMMVETTSPHSSNRSGSELGNKSDAALDHPISDSLAAAQSITTKNLDDSTKTLAAQTESGAYSGPIIGETDDHVLQRQSARFSIAHPKELLDRQPEIGQNVRIKYSNFKGAVRDVRARARAQEVSR